jgi:hypothetical protein
LAYTRLEQWDLALADANLIRQTPGATEADQVYALYTTVQAYVGLGKLDDASRTYGQLDALAGTAPQLRAAALVALGWGAYLQKDYRRSIEWSRRAIAVDVFGRCTALANLGLALLHYGDIIAANKEYATLIADCGERQSIESALHDLRSAMESQAQLPGAQGIYNDLMARLAAL